MTTAVRAPSSHLLAVAVWLWLTLPGVTLGQTGNQEGQLELLDGSTRQGALVQLADSWLNWHRTGDSAPERIALDEVRSVRWRDAGQPPAKPTLWLRDGSQVFANQMSIEGEGAQWTDAWNQQRSIPRSEIRAIFPKGLTDLPEATALVESIDNWNSGDDGLMVLRNGAWSPIEGRAGQLNNGSLEFSIGDQTAQIPIERAGALVFGSLESRAPASRPILTTVDGQKFLIAQMVAEGAEAKLKCPLGLEASVPAAQLANLEVAASRSVWLSELTPTTNDWRPLLATPQLENRLREWHLARFNRGFDGQPLGLATRDRWNQATINEYERGLAVAAGGRLAFQLAGKYQNLAGLVGFAPTAHPAGDVTLTLSLDGQVRWQQRLTRGQMQSPLSIELPVSGAQRLLIEVGFGDGRAVGDQLHLVDLELTE